MSDEKMRESFEAWMSEEIPALYLGKKVMLSRFDTMSEHEEDIARAAWQASRAALVIDLPTSCSKKNTEVIKAVGRHIFGQGIQVRP